MRVDKATLLGVVMALGGISWGLILEGGSLQEIWQPTAALIVLGGTFGATLVAQPLSLVVRAGRQLLGIFTEPRYQVEEVIERIVALSNQARRNGIVSLEKQADEIPHHFLRKAVMLAVDGAEAHEIRRVMELEIEQEAARRDAEARVFETAGGFAPTIGIIGAVLGLIQVMKHLENIDEVGKGIAVAFVATIYGVGVANLFLLPASKKILIRSQQDSTIRELMLEGIVSLAEGLNPRLIQQRLEGFVEHRENVEPAPRKEIVGSAARPQEADGTAKQGSA